MLKRFGLLFLLAVSLLPWCECAFAAAGEAARLQHSPVRLHLNYEQLDISPDEKLGLLGAHYLVAFDNDWYFGPSVFSAMDGERGGFFTGGFTAGTRRRIAKSWYWDSGLFVGAGGGGSAPQGGGMMVRPHLGISYDLGNLSVDGAVSYINFPNGDIESTQFSLGLGIPFTAYYGRATDTGRTILPLDLRGLSPRETEWLATWREYQPDAPAKTTHGAEMPHALQVLGFEYRHYLWQQGYLLAEAAGAAGGHSDGYAELMAGIGYRVPLSRRWSSTASVALGGAGGGRVDTDGGLSGKLGLGLEYAITPSLKLGIEAGRMESAGSFAADVYGMHLGYRIGTVAGGQHSRLWPEGKPVRLAGWRIVAAQHTVQSAARKHGEPRDLHLLGGKVERFLDRSIYVTGQAFGAYDGGAGGYAVGLIGAGWELPLRRDRRLALDLELAAGAAGGGSVDVGGGTIVQPMAALIWRMNKTLGLRLEAGRVSSDGGALDSNMLGLALQFEFSRPEYGNREWR